LFLSKNNPVWDYAVKFRMFLTERKIWAFGHISNFASGPVWR
jgi:hypothetical protein